MARRDISGWKRRFGEYQQLLADMATSNANESKSELARRRAIDFIEEFFAAVPREEDSSEEAELNRRMSKAAALLRRSLTSDQWGIEFSHGVSGPILAIYFYEWEDDGTDQPRIKWTDKAKLGFVPPEMLPEAFFKKTGFAYAKLAQEAVK